MVAVVVLAAGAKLERADLADTPIVIAADGGAEAARALGHRVDLVVGDFDSISPATLAELERNAVRIERHPVAKDATDLELALNAALAFEPQRILVLGDAGGRLDHLLGVLLLLGVDAYKCVELDARLGSARVHVVRGERALTGTRGETISLYALHGPATGVTTNGLLYPLLDATLLPGSSLGSSNELTDTEAHIVVEGGVLLVVRPGSG